MYSFDIAVRDKIGDLCELWFRFQDAIKFQSDSNLAVKLRQGKMSCLLTMPSELLFELQGCLASLLFSLLQLSL